MSFCQSVCQSVYLLPVGRSIFRPPIIHPSTHPSINVYPHPSIHPFILSFCLSFWLWSQSAVLDRLTLPKQQILDSSRLKAFADNNFRFDENGRKFFMGVENTMGKGEIALYEQFLLFQQCFQKTCTADTLKQGLVWERVRPLQLIASEN